MAIRKNYNKGMEDQIKKTIKEVQDLLIYKNKSYGNSATNPAKIFSKGSAVESICARIDDKLMRVANKGLCKNTLDTVDDLIGYLVLLKIAIHKQDEEKNK